jgi:succinate dehydrogenase/fumarate reductase flavoprotein subunit
MSQEISRRGFVEGAALGVAAAGIAGGAVSASAAESSSFDAEYDVVVIGIGFSGMVSAMSAADAGAKVLLVEKLPDGQAGGNSRVCGQMFFYGNENTDSTKAYLTELMGSREVPEDMLDLYAEGYAGLADTVAKYAALDKADFLDVATMGEAMAKMSPEYPEFDGQEDCHLWSTHEGVSDSYLYQSVRANLESNYADTVEVWFESPAQSLIQDDEGAVTGVVVEHEGANVSVGAKGVVLACGGFENDAELIAAYVNLADYRCIGALGNTGDGIRMAQGVSAKMWHMTSWAGGFGLAGLSWTTDEGNNAILIDTLTQGALNTGASILVGKQGRRWVNESETPRHGKVSNGNGQWLNPDFPDGAYLILDKTQYDAAVEAEEIAEDCADQIVECATVADVAETIGCDEATLQDTIDKFNSFAENGEDLQFGRDAEYMRAFDGEAYYAIPLVPAMLNTQGGPVRDVDCHILGIDDEPIPGLYGAGELGGITSQMYAGGMNVGECFITGNLAGANAAAGK